MAKKNNPIPKQNKRIEEGQNRNSQKGRTTPIPSSKLGKPSKKN